MDISTITVDDFKDQFFRDFPYLPVYSGTELYNTGDVVYYETTKLFYKAKQDGITGIAPTDATKWERISGNTLDYILDKDIANAFTEADITFNQSLFGEDAQVKIGFLYLSAHFLCNDIRAAKGGINSTAMMPMTGRSVGSVSESYGIPETYLKNPVYAFYTSSAYGLKFLAMALPAMVGNMSAVAGSTLP